MIDTKSANKLDIDLTSLNNRRERPKSEEIVQESVDLNESCSDISGDSFDKTKIFEERRRANALMKKDIKKYGSDSESVKSGE
jgi:hypothetical protein